MFSYSTPLLSTLKAVKFRIIGLAVIRHKEMPNNINVKERGRELREGCSGREGPGEPMMFLGMSS